MFINSLSNTIKIAINVELMNNIATIKNLLSLYLSFGITGYEGKVIPICDACLLDFKISIFYFRFKFYNFFL